MARQQKQQTANNREALVSFSLRVGLAVVFLYASISALLNPTAWVGFVPSFVKAIIPAQTFLFLHSLGEIALSLWLLSNKQTFYAAILSALAMVAIVVFNIGALDIIFRDIAIFFSAVALAILTYEKR